MDSGLVGLTIKYAAATGFLYVFLVVAYRLLFHPLRNYPGPFLAKISDVYAGFFAAKMCLHLTTYSDLKKYGPVIRHGPNKLVFNSPAALQDIYNNQPKVQKSRVYLLTVSGKPSIFNMLDNRQHRNRRKITGQSISEKAMRDFEPIMTEQIEVFIQQLAASTRASSPVNMTERCKRLGMDIVALLAFGYDLKLQTEATNRHILAGLSVGTYQFNCFMQFPFLKTLRVDRLLEVLAYRQKQKYTANLRQMIGARLSESPQAKRDLYSFFAKHIEDTADAIETSEIFSEAFLFFPAGGDTTTTVITALFFYLSRNPTAHKTLAAEVRGAFATYADIRGGPRLTGCRYLRACIDEAMRISPPVAGAMWRETDPTAGAGPVVIDGHVVPPGTQVGVCAYALHHDEAYFARPFEFDPSRWLPSPSTTGAEAEAEAEAERLRRMTSAFMPFLLGPRGCAGKAMAYLEAGLVVAKAVWRFDFDAAPGAPGAVGEGAPGRGPLRERPGEFQLYDTFGSRHDGPHLVFRERAGAAGGRV